MGNNATIAGELAFKPLDPRVLADPYSEYARLREQATLFFDTGLNAWVALGYDECLEVLRSADRYVRDRRRVGQEVPDHQLSFSMLDRPQLGALRTLFLAGIRVHDTGKMIETAKSNAMDRLAHLSRSGDFDFIGGIAIPFTVEIARALCGIPRVDQDKLRSLIDPLAMGMDAGLDPARVADAQRARESLNALIDAWLSDHDDDGVLHQCQSAGEIVAPSLLKNSIRFFLMSIVSTTAAAIGNAVYALLCRPDYRELIHGACVHSVAAHELIRYDSAAQVVSAVAADDLELSGQAVKRGQEVYAIIGSANRDPSIFASPDTLNLSRFPNKHLGFGWGQHACLGTGVGISAVEAILAILAGTDRPLCLAAPPTRPANATVRRITTLPVRAGARSRHARTNPAGSNTRPTHAAVAHTKCPFA